MAAPSTRPSVVTNARVFAIAGPAMLANLTTPLLGIVGTAAIGRLGVASLLGGVAMAALVFDSLYWLFAFLRMGTVALTAQALGAGDATEQRAVLARALFLAAFIGHDIRPMTSASRTMAKIAMMVDTTHLASRPGPRCSAASPAPSACAVSATVPMRRKPNSQ